MESRWRWRWFGRDLADILFATFMASLGTAALVLCALRRLATGVTPPAFAVFAMLYGVSLPASTAMVPLALGGRPGSRAYGRTAPFGDQRFHAVIADHAEGRPIWRGRSSSGTR